MVLINPQTLKALRKAAGRSIKQLADKSMVGSATIKRIEAGNSASDNRATTVQRLAVALGCKPEDLARPPEDLASQAPRLGAKPVKFEMQPETWNAFALVARRYGETGRAIVSLAPLLFDLFARESLKARQEALNELSARRERVAEMQAAFPHLSGRFTCDWAAEDCDGREQQSIANRDLRGSQVNPADEADCDSFLPLRYDEAGDNPLVTHLRQRLAAVDASDDATIDEWPRTASANFRFCRDEALALAGGDEWLAQSIHDGTVCLAEMPSDLATDDRVAERQAWMRAEVEKNSAWVRELLAGLDLDLGGEDD